MNILKKMTLASMLYGVICFSSAETVSVTSGPGPKLSNAEEIIYSAKCAGYKYEVRYQQNENNLLFFSNKRRIDITDTPLGRNFKNSALYGRIGLACLPSALNIQFFGFSTLSGVTEPVMYRAVLNNSGTVEGGEIQPTTQHAVISNQIN